MDKKCNGSKLNIWLTILLVAAIVVAIVSLVGKNNQTKDLNTANEKIKQMQEEYDAKAVELQKQIDEKTQELNDQKDSAKAELEKIIKEKDEAAAKITEEKDKKIAELNTQISDTEKKIEEITNENKGKFSQEEIDKKVSEAIAPLQEKIDEFNKNQEGLKKYISEFVLKYSNDITTNAKDVVSELSNGLAKMFAK